MQSAEDRNAAVARCLELGIWPKDVKGLDVEMVPVDLEYYRAQDLDRMLDKEEALRLGEAVVIRHCASLGRTPQ